MSEGRKFDFATLVKEMPELKQLVDEVRELRDRRDILRTLNRYTHAVDRHDWDMLHNEVYHPDGVAIHDGVVGSSRDLAAYLERMYSERYLAHAHTIGNHLCEVSGNIAHTETYCTFHGLMAGGQEIDLTYARYVDRLEKRDGLWKIALRRVVTDARSRIPAKDNFIPQSRRDHGDLSYARPFTMPKEFAARVGKPPIMPPK